MKDGRFPSVREAGLVVGIAALFLILTAACIGLRTEHFLMAGLFLALFFAGNATRKLAVALLPFIVFGISYDWMRVYPNYQVNPIDVQGLYEAEKSLFGVSPCIIARLPISLPASFTCAGCLFPLLSVCGSI